MGNPRKEGFYRVQVGGLAHNLIDSITSRFCGTGLTTCEAAAGAT